MSALGLVEDRAGAAGLDVLGIFEPGADDGLPVGWGTLVMLGPREPGFWPGVTAAPEFADGRPDPLDRWSRRVIGRLACDLGGKAYFPFGRPHRPFVAWALRTGRCWLSPSGLLVHDRQGLMVSFRGAILLRDRFALAGAGSSPCLSCAAKPCLSACPVSAISEAGYGIDGCRDYLQRHRDNACMTGGCLARRACPIGKHYGRLPEQSAYHMRQFLG